MDVVKEKEVGVLCQIISWGANEGHVEEVLDIIIVNACGVDFGGVDVHQKAFMLRWREEWGVESDGCVVLVVVVVVVQAMWRSGCGVMI